MIPRITDLRKTTDNLNLISTLPTELQVPLLGKKEWIKGLPISRILQGVTDSCKMVGSQCFLSKNRAGHICVLKAQGQTSRAILLLLICFPIAFLPVSGSVLSSELFPSPAWQRDTIRASAVALVCVFFSLETRGRRVK